MRSEILELDGHAGRLAARLDLPDGPPRACAAFVHCFTCTKELPAVRRIAERLALEGLATLSFDLTGLGGSEGEFGATDLATNFDDVILACRQMDARGLPVRLLIGHSFGGAAALGAAGRIEGLEAVATIAAPADPAHVLHRFDHALERIATEGAAEVSLAGRPFTIGKSFLEQARSIRLREAVAELKLPLLVLHAPRDTEVGVENASEIFLAAKHPKSFVSLDDADHLLRRRADADYAGKVIAAWALRYVTLSETAHNGDSDILVSEADPEGFRQFVAAGPHSLTADEPKSFGGTDRGFTPYELVSAGLGACTSMTIRMAARKRKLALSRVSVEVSHAKIHAEDCGDCETNAGRIDRFTRRLRIEGDLTQEQRAYLVGVADRCPVHKTLEGEIDIETESL